MTEKNESSIKRKFLVKGLLFCLGTAVFFSPVLGILSLSPISYLIGGMYGAFISFH